MAIIGHGDLASVLIDQADKIFFASGVSNSGCADWYEFQREKDLLLTQSKFSHLVYFSTLSIYYADTPYTRHKKLMERLVKDNFAVTTIVRLGTITWGDNPNILINYLKKDKSRVENTYRYLIGRDEFKYWMTMIPDWTTEMNITGQRMSIQEIVNRYVL